MHWGSGVKTAPSGVEKNFEVVGGFETTNAYGLGVAYSVKRGSKTGRQPKHETDARQNPPRGPLRRVGAARAVFALPAVRGQKWVDPLHYPRPLYSHHAPNSPGVRVTRRRLLTPRVTRMAPMAQLTCSSQSRPSPNWVYEVLATRPSKLAPKI